MRTLSRQARLTRVFLLLAVILPLVTSPMFFPARLAANLCSVHIVWKLIAVPIEKPLGRMCELASGLGNESAYRMLGRAALAEGDINSAHQNLLSAYALRPEDELTAYWLGMVEEGLGNYVSALALMHQAGRSEYWPDGIGAWLEVDRVSRIGILLKDLEGEEIGQRAKFELAKLAFEAGREHLAERYFEQSLQKLDIHDFYAQCIAIGWFYANNQSHDLAEVWAQKALDRRSNGYEAYEILARAYQDTGDLQHTIEMLETAIAYAPSPGYRARPQTRLGSIYVKLKRYDLAIPLLRNATENHNDPSWAYYWLLEAYLGAGNCSAVRKTYWQINEASIDLSPVGLELIRDQRKRIVSCQTP